MLTLLQRQVFKVLSHQSRRQSTFFLGQRSFAPYLWTSVFIVTASLALRPAIRLDADIPRSMEFETDPATSIEFPKTLTVPSNLPLPQFSLVGLGVRTVSFLGIKVYSVGFYADLTNPNLDIPKSASAEEKIEHIVRNTACVIRIVPTRSTSYSHLRDGFMRTLLGRMKLFHTRGTITEQEERDTQSPLRTLKSIFPNAPLAKHTPLEILLTAPSKDPKRPRALVVRDMGAVENDWVSREFVLAYFEGDGISPPLKRSVSDRLKDYGN